MHEVSLVADLIAACELSAAGEAVELVRVRHATTIPAPALHQAFQMLTETGALAGATLQSETFDINLNCGCGFTGALGHDDLINGTIAVCPACGAVSTLPRTAEIELLEVRTAPGGPNPV